MVHIRAAKRGDEPVVSELVRALAEYERLAHEVEATPEMLAEALFAEHPRVFCDIAEVDGEAVGFALWFYTFSTFRGRHGIYLEDLFVRPEKRSLGVGKALLQHLARRCAKENLGRLEWSVLDWNEPAIAFYKSQGARLSRRLDHGPRRRSGPSGAWRDRYPNSMTMPCRRNGAEGGEIRLNPPAPT